VILRPYQQAAVEAVYDYLRRFDGNPAVVLPTGAGKSLIIAQLAKDAVVRWGGRVLVLAHVKELVGQNAEKIGCLCPELPVGIYSAGLNRRDTARPVIVAGIQSVYRRACELGRVDLVIVDEAHLIPPDGEGMYRTFLSEARIVNPQLRVIGLTATPYRLGSGMICGPDNVLNTICYEASVRELIRDGFLCPLITKAGREKADTSQLQVRGGEFVADEVEELMDQDLLVKAACAEIVALAFDRRSCLLFTAGIKHGEHVARVLRDISGQEVGFICADTPTSERDDLLARFRSGSLRYLANVNVLTTGFDAPNIGCIAILRPTMSPGLFYQICGRGFRQHPGKTNCLVLDFGGNVLRHGPVDQIRVPEVAKSGSGEAPAKECPECRALIATGYATCPSCGYKFPPPERQQHNATASTAGILSGQVTETEFDVQEINYSVHTKRGAPRDAPKSFRVEYRIGFNNWHSEFVCLEHDGYARQKAIAWWRRRSPDPVPDTAARAVEIADAGGLADTKRITIRNITGEKFDRVIAYDLGPIPEPIPTGEFGDGDLDDIPF
jgi:DNA repair protein RadD